jgi:predicted esterase
MVSSFQRAVFVGAWLFAATTHGETARAESSTREVRWCAPELRVFGENVCFYSPSGEATSATGSSGTLVIFLHSLIGAEHGAAWEQQRRLTGAAEAYGFSTLIPRGRPGLGPGRDGSVLGWPTAPELQEQYEAELLDEWRVAREQAERVAGPFDRVLLFGFSNGAYYAESLAFREVVAIDGVGLFAGGSGSRYQHLLATRAKRRVPLFLGYGTKDADRGRQKELHEMLQRIDWPHRALAASVGHTVTDAQLRSALAFLGHPVRGK